MSTGPFGPHPGYPRDPRVLAEVPGYEFEVPRAAWPGTGQAPVADGLTWPDQDPMRHLGPAESAPGPTRPVRALGPVLAAMRARNWVISLAIPILAAVLVGVAAVAIVGGGGGGGAAPSALDAGFPPARVAGTDFTGATIASPVVLDTIAAAAGTEVAAGSADGNPALWVSADGGSTWGRAVLTGATARSAGVRGALAGVAHGPAGWLAVGTVRAARAGPIVARSPDGQTWTATGGATALPGATDATVAAAVAAGPAGYVIVGRQAPRTAAGGPARAAAWYAPEGTGWRRAVITRAAAASRPPSGAQEMTAVTATARGFAAVGRAGADPAAWLSSTARTWRPVTLPLPDGAVRAAFDSVAASGDAVVAVGTAVSAAGSSTPFAEVSADAGATWRPTPLPVPAAGAAASTVTALTATGRGFTATGTYAVAGGADVVVWTLPSIARTGAGWTVATPPGQGLAGRGTQAITALAAGGATLTGVGFTTASGERQPTLWQSPIRG